MIVLALRTDKPDAEIYLLQDGTVLDQIMWQAHRQLAETIHQKISLLLFRNELSLSQAQGVIVNEGPGSFTGLRIGVSVANALAYSLNVPLIGSTGEDWIHVAEALPAAFIPVVPFYGSDPHITAQKK